MPGQERVSDARIKLEIVDVNDNSPVFDQEVSTSTKGTCDCYWIT